MICYSNLQDYDIKGYQIFRDTVLEELITREDTTLESLIERYHRAYAAAGQELSRDAVIDEIIADSTADFLNDHNFVNKIAKKQPSLARKILDFLHDFIESIKGFMIDTQNNGVVKALKEKQELYQNLRGHLGRATGKCNIRL